MSPTTKDEQTSYKSLRKKIAEKSAPWADLGSVQGRTAFPGTRYSFCWHPPSGLRNLAGQTLSLYYRPGAAPGGGTDPRTANSERWLPLPRPRGRQNSGADPSLGGKLTSLFAPGRDRRFPVSPRNSSPGQMTGSRSFFAEGAVKS